ncbi:NTP transferase domain-containing protein [Kaustia mangrovi]|uniref:NTP transferase domain-containing protein n=1 Tax=Kaustia mangrovi TaxID=2593653 RepID=A0A7S8HCZ7_9HYPH|nr:nucleotidyltransferase family protein [Kaustia mangrovi]QPC44247.1 NTP transferase domain-containing protein [Kaustia mangrovi]
MTADASFPRYDVLVLAAGRGPDDPMAKAFGVSHKCLVELGGVPMLARVLKALAAAPHIGRIVVSIDRPDIVAQASAAAGDVEATAIASTTSAPASVIAAASSGELTFPLLVTTGDHALLTAEMVQHFLAESAASGADLTVGLAREETIAAAYPETKRTYFAFGRDRVSGCNLFALNSEQALKAIAFWARLDRDRKHPFRLMRAFGLSSLALYALGRLDLDRAFARASRKLGLVARPVDMPFAEAAIDVDKPADKRLVDEILSKTGHSPGAV